MRRTVALWGILSFCLCGTIEAETLRVPSVYGTIQAAIDAAGAGDTVLVASGTYTGTGNRDISFLGKSLVLLSESGPENTIIDAEGSYPDYHRCVVFTSGEDTNAVLQGFTLTGGHCGVAVMSGSVERGALQPVDYYGGGIYVEASSPRIVGNRIRYNEGTFGGGIYCENSNAVIEGNDISNNIASLQGGGVACSACSMSVRFNDIHDNRAYMACYVYGIGLCCSGGTYRIDSNTIRSQEGGGWGMGIYVGACDSVLITNNEISSNTDGSQRPGRGGGIYVSSSGVEISHNTISSNWAAPGGGVYIAAGSSVVVRENTISGNSGYNDPSLGYGGGLYLESADQALIENNLIIGNSAAFGGGIYAAGAGTVSCNRIVDNEAEYQDYTEVGGSGGGSGGGIYCAGSADIIGNTLFGNSCPVDDPDPVTPAGAGVYCTDSSAPFISGNIIANGAFDKPGDGGGIYCETSAAPVITCCDIWNNEGGNYGGSLTDLTGTDGNISVDPMFCQPVGNEYSISIHSPCMPGNHPDGASCGLIGAGEGQSCIPAITGLAGEPMYIGNELQGLLMTWDENPAPYVSHYAIYRGLDESFVPGSSNLLAEITVANYYDEEWEWMPCRYYKVCVVDTLGYESEYATLTNEDIYTGDGPFMPSRATLEQNYPNPFNPETRIAYYVPSRCRVVIDVFDVTGRKIARLMDDMREQGYHAVDWNGKNRMGEPVGSGVYLYRMTAGDVVISNKMVLIR